MIELSTVCNLRCPLCLTGNGSLQRRALFLDFSLYATLVREVRGHVPRLSLYGQGEPFLHPRFIDFVSLASQNGIRTFVSTNGHFLQTDGFCRDLAEAGLTSLSISLDGASPETYQTYRVGGDFARVLDGIRRMVRVRTDLGRTTPLVQLQFLVFKHNEHELQSIRELARDLAVDSLRIKSAQVYTFDQGRQYLPSNPRYSRYHDDGRLRIRAQQNFNCWHLHNQPVVTTDGLVLPCCFDKNSDFVMGLLGKQSLNTIWHSDGYDDFRRIVAESRSSISMCLNCDQGLEEVVAHQEHVDRPGQIHGSTAK